MEDNYDLLLDSDAFLGLLKKGDAHQKRSQLLLQKIYKNNLKPATTNLVVLEVSNVLSNREGPESARVFLSFVDDFEQIFVDEVSFQESLDLFKKQNKKGTSVVDCSNVILMKKYQILKIFSFDQAYPKQYQVKLFN